MATVPIHFDVADAIVCTEGNGPLAGTARRLDRIVLSDDPVAADATCTRMMGLVPSAFRTSRRLLALAFGVVVRLEYLIFHSLEDGWRNSDFRNWSSHARP